jgi:hypothetical protein
MSNYSRYKSKHSYNFNGLSDIIAYLAVLAIVVVVFFFGVNACTAKEWNGGKCPDCNVRYELRGVYRGTHYYACPDCGNEVSRYGGK